MNAREVFPNAPLQLVVFEARYVGGSEAGRDALDALSSRLGPSAQIRFGVPVLRLADEEAVPEAPPSLGRQSKPRATSSVARVPVPRPWFSIPMPSGSRRNQNNSLPND